MDALTVLLSVGVFIAGVGTVLALFTLSSRGDQDARDAPAPPVDAGSNVFSRACGPWPAPDTTPGSESTLWRRV